jgi:hypothetical protein
MTEQIEQKPDHKRWQNREFRCQHGFAQGGARGVRCTACSGENVKSYRCESLLVIGKCYAGCRLLAQAAHVLTVKCSACDEETQVSKSTLMHANRHAQQWRCKGCRTHQRCPQVERKSVPSGYETLDGRRKGEGNTNARRRY